MTTTFHSLAHLIENAIEVHHLSAPLYESLQHKTGDPPCKELLKQMAENEARMANQLEEMVERADDDILDTRLQYAREQVPQEFIDSITPETDELSLEQIGRLGEQLHGYLIELLEGASHKIPSTQGEELLQNIMQLEKAEGRSFSRKANAAFDM
ncbi:hypothetical protein Q6D67_01245 [Haliea sp. E1-2-M8]|uniref:hypothetical protein n=1 Tax=Haliea sp. E1-2-M8 TaxID=3064706 RepID=UPI00271BBB11|nr:hypothetical protein [Haliea sp. E1-2-M8]MDO8860309.1 hypothetical protein [Haliea sp. E1-2-M8]